MKEVFIVNQDNKSKAERILKQDEKISRCSITVKEPASLDIQEEGYFIVLDAGEEDIKKAEELLKDLAKKYDNSEKVIEKIKEQEDNATQGLGNILG
ncbi:hypothetical protein ACFLQN_03280 [Candidatus Aenigmatarchaeota archaeon]